MTKKNLFATVLTYAAPSSNYRGESEENRTVLQKITRAGQEFTVISPDSMRNALREILASRGLPSNRRRLHDKDQLAVEFKEFPDAAKFADDFLFGFMVALTGAKLTEARKAMGKRPMKRDSVLRMNLAVALSPYRFDATLHQSPMNAGESPWKNAEGSALLHREVAHTAYQFPFALNLADCSAVKEGPAWTKALLAAIAELSNVAGSHARSYFEMAPKSVVARLSPSLVAGYDSYGFQPDGSFPELKRVTTDDLPGGEFWLGGELVRAMPTDVREGFARKGVTLDDNPQRLLQRIGEAAFAGA